MCLPLAEQKGMLRLQLGQSSRVSGIWNLQNGHGLRGSGSSSCFTGLLAICSIFVLNLGGILSMFSGLISTQDQLYACCLRLAYEHSPMVVVIIFTMLFGN